MVQLKEAGLEMSQVYVRESVACAAYISCAIQFKSRVRFCAFDIFWTIICRWKLCWRAIHRTGRVHVNSWRKIHMLGLEDQPKGVAVALDESEVMVMIWDFRAWKGKNYLQIGLQYRYGREHIVWNEMNGFSVGVGTLVALILQTDGTLVSVQPKKRGFLLVTKMATERPIKQQHAVKLDSCRFEQ